MATSSILLLCVLVVCSVWTVQARHLNVKTDDDDEDQVELFVEHDRLSLLCKACTWAIGRVKKTLGKNSTVEIIKTKLLSVCDRSRVFKSICRKFVKSHLDVLIKELTTNDNVNTICFKAKACKREELEELLQTDLWSQMEKSEYADGR